MKRWIWVAVSLSLIFPVVKFYPLLQRMFAESPPEPTMVTQENILNHLQEKAEEKAELNYLVLGDSVARGFGSEKSGSHGYSSLVARGLAEDDIPLHLINRGVIGQTSKQLTGYIQTRNIRQEIREADLISLTIGGNDLLKAALQDHDPLRILTDFNRIQSGYKKSGCHSDGNPGSQPGSPDLDHLPLQSGITRRAIFKVSNRLLKSWNIGMKEVAYSCRLTHVVDVTDRLMAGKGNWLSDEIHPNDRGYRWMAEGILEEIRANRSVSASAG